MIDEITKCRICDNTELIPVVDLGFQYLTSVPVGLGKKFKILE